MQVSLKSQANIRSLKTTCLVVPVDKAQSHPALKELAATLDLKTLDKRGDLQHSVGKSVLLPLVNGIAAERVLLLGCGDSLDMSEADAIKWLNAAIGQANKAQCKDAALLLKGLSIEGRDDAWLVQTAAKLAGLAGYHYSSTLAKKKPGSSSLRKLQINLGTKAALKTAADRGLAIANGMNTARELGNLPGNVCTPSHLAKKARAMGRQYEKLSVSVLDEKKMRELGMHSLLSVTAGTDEPAKLIVFNYKGGKKADKPQALVGKGITFDSGGISLKPGARMDEMKFDMCGAASVFGTVESVARMELPINLVAVVAAVENMPSGSATKPGDVVTSMSGQTIEILNTDAEGRLVLCDALTYVGKYKPKAVIDIATLTGACVVALGKHATGLYSNDDGFAAELLAAGNKANDKAWHMPLWEEYQQQLNSNFADIGNIGGPEAGSVTAACFLARFTKEYRWAHMDIAGTAWLSGGSKGATGRPVALLCQYLIDAA